MADRWDALARLVVLHGEVCVALALLRGRLGEDCAWAAHMARGERRIADQLAQLARARGAPRPLREAARRHAESAAHLLG